MDTPSKQPTQRLLLSPREVARMLGICERTLYALTKAGDIPVVRIGRAVRYSVDDLQDWIRRHSGKNVRKSAECI